MAPVDPGMAGMAPARRSRREAAGRRLRLAAILVALALVGLALGVWRRGGDGAPPGRPGAVRIAVYGDSLVTQAGSYFRAVVESHGKADLVLRSYPGTAICDWLHDMSETARKFKPQAVELEFSGDSLTPCMRDPATRKLRVGAARVARYRDDAKRVMGIFAKSGATVYWIGAPPARDRANTEAGAAIRAIYETLPSEYPAARYEDAGQAVLDGGKYADYLPCLPFEACLGPRIGGSLTNRVRSPDGIHFCPENVRGDGVCPVYSSGAFRFAAAMAAPLVTDFGL